MKLKNISLLILALAPLGVFAAAPIQPEVQTHFDAIETQTGARTGWLRQARAIFDVTGYDSSGVANTTVATHGLGAKLPAHSHITRGWMEISRHFDSAGTIALQCEDAGNLFAATNLSIANYTNGTLVRLIPQDTLATVVQGTTIAAQCEISAVVATAHTGSGGKAVIFVEYWVGE